MPSPTNIVPDGFTRKPDTSTFTRTLHWIMLAVCFISLGLAFFFFYGKNSKLGTIFLTIGVLLFIPLKYTFFRMYPQRSMGH